jgi:hypothetical protein
MCASAEAWFFSLNTDPWGPPWSVLRFAQSETLERHTILFGVFGLQRRERAEQKNRQYAGARCKGELENVWLFEETCLVKVDMRSRGELCQGCVPKTSFTCSVQ